MTTVASTHTATMAEVANAALENAADIHNCGAAGCFKGWAIAVQDFYGERYDKNDKYIRPGTWLGLTPTQEHRLFFTWPQSKEFAFDSVVRPRGGWRKWMLKRLDSIIKTQRVPSAR